ncbi:MAG: hypothetical protein QF645_08050 [Planctomycetota bacterium]|nr:hypothetical protein [Planctomycetota bacterium]
MGITCRILSPAGAMMFYIRLKAFKLKEDITIFSDETQATPLLNIKARSIIDFSAAYDVVDTQSGEKVGAFRRKGWKSFLKDEWEILDLQDQVVGHMKEDSAMMAILRRFLSNLIPQNFTFEMGGNVVGDLTGTWNPFVVKYDVDLSKNSQSLLDKRMALAGTVLLMAIEGKQN